MSQVAYFGGSFNPIHWGHLAILNSLINNPNYKYIILVPCFSPYYKQSNLWSLKAQEIIHTLKLVQQHTKSTKVFISLIDYYQQFKGKTLLHLKYLKRQCIKTQHLQEFSIVLGEDNLIHLQNWFKIDKIKDEFSFHIVTRPTHTFHHFSTMPLEKKVQTLQIPKYTIHPEIQYSISSSKIRNQIVELIQQNITKNIILWIQKQMQHDNVVEYKVQNIIKNIYQYIEKCMH